MFDKNKLIEDLHGNICQVIFTKVNGEERVMSCTLNKDILPEITEDVVKNPREKNEESLAVWDTDKGAWRSFRWDSLKEFKTEVQL